MRFKVKNIIFNLINKFLDKFFGMNICRSASSFDLIRSKLINNYGITVAIDGGANSGQWALNFQKKNKNILLHSFEPINELFNRLEQLADGNSDWYVHNFALGSIQEKSKIYLASNDFMSSSILKPAEHLSAFPKIKFGDSQEISIRRLDSFSFGENNSLILLKLDVQGFEFEALKGAERILNRIAVIEIETSFWPMYEGEKSHSEILIWLENLGFNVYFIGQPLIDESGRIGYLDCLLVNSNLPLASKT